MKYYLAANSGNITIPANYVKRPGYVISGVGFTLRTYMS